MPIHERVRRSAQRRTALREAPPRPVAPGLAATSDREGHGQVVPVVQKVCPPVWQQRGGVLPSPHSQHALAGTYGLQVCAAQIWFAAQAVPHTPQ
jgi:hypothetical protein